MSKSNFNIRKFIFITLVTSIWINVSEVFRYFVFIQPRVQAYFDYQPGIAEIDLPIFAIWGLWDTILTSVLVLAFWIFAQTFGNNNRSVMISATFTWISVFVIFWVATANMGLAAWSILLIALPLSWIEMLGGAWLAARLYARREAEPSVV